MERPLRENFRDRRASLRAWQDRIRDPSLGVLLFLQVFLLFVALPLDAAGVPVAEPVAWSLLLLVLALVVMLSQRRLAIVSIVVGFAALVVSFASGQKALISTSLLSRGGIILIYLTLAWVVSHAVYAPGRITFHRLQGAAVMYLSIAIIFAMAFSVIGELVPNAFANLPAVKQRGPGEFATMLYFSLATLTTTGYGDIVPLDPFARSLATLEALSGQFFLAITVARLVTLEMADWRRGGRE